MSIDKILRLEVEITKDVIAQYIPIFCGFINTFVDMMDITISMIHVVLR